MRDRLRGAPRESLFCFTNISGLLRVASASKKKGCIFSGYDEFSVC